MPEPTTNGEHQESERQTPDDLSAFPNDPHTESTTPSTFVSKKSSRLNSSVWLGTAFELGLGLLAAVLAHCLSIDPWRQISFGVIPVLGYTTGCLPLLIALAFLLRSNWQILRELRGFVDTFVLPLFDDAHIVELAILCAAAGFGEELLFRGVLQPIGVKYLGLYGGVLVVNVLFSLLHPFSIAYLVLACLIGCYMSVLYVATDNLLAPMIVHGLYDFVALVWMMRGSWK
jgi:membrane protease YdiL (CAAX protease family)